VHATTLGTEGCTKTQKNTSHGCIWHRQVIDSCHHKSLGSIPWQSKWGLWWPKYLRFLPFSPGSIIPPVFRIYSFIYWWHYTILTINIIIK